MVDFMVSEFIIVMYRMYVCVPPVDLLRKVTQEIAWK